MATVVQITEGYSRRKRSVRASRGKAALVQFPERLCEPQARLDEQNAVGFNPKSPKPLPEPQACPKELSLRSDPKSPKPLPDRLAALWILLGCVVLGGCRRAFHSARAGG